MNNLDVKETQPSISETITVERPLYQQPSSPAGLPKVQDGFDFKHSGYFLWWCSAFWCALPTACCLGKKMGDKLSWLKYGVPGKLVFDLYFNWISIDHFMASTIKFHLIY